MRRLVKSDSGQAIVEVALVAPLLLLLALGAIDVGRFAQFDARLASSARAGAQYGSQNLVTAADTAGMSAAGTNDVQNQTGITVAGTSFCKCADGSSTACTASACSANHRLLYVSVSATGTFKPLFKYIFGVSASPRVRTAIMQVGE
jgi:Flp pilus assembly protein TadG